MLDVNTNQRMNNSQCLDCYQMASSLIVLEPVAMIEVVKYHENDNQEIIKKNVNDSSHVLRGGNFETMCLDVMDPHYQEEEEDDDGGSGSDGGQEKRKAYLHSVLAAYQDHLLERADHFLGYPCYVDKDRSELTHQLQPFPINNVGDPFTPSTYAIHSRQFEIAVLDWFARLWGIEKNKYWGYVTNGNTEGNCHGILIGREMFPDGILYASRDSHYSVTKAAFMYRMELMTVDSLITGELNCADFKTKLLLNKNKPAIILVNIGTTIKGAVDDLDEVIKTLEETGFTQDRFYIHCDGALSGFMLPFLKNAPELTFKKPIGSISVSGHKFMGCPTPCGIQITRMEHINTLSRKIEYIATLDATITGSRSGHTPIFLWCILNQQGYKGFGKRVQKCIDNARYLKERLQEEGISVLLNEFSNTVVFERPKDDGFVRHWQLACQGSIAHIVIMPTINTEKLDYFLNELVQKRSFWYKDQDKDGPPCVAQVIGNENCACFMHKYSSISGRLIAGKSGNGYIPQN